MKIATWNVNSMNVRQPHVVEWLQAHGPDVLVLQEIKQVTEKFPADDLQANLQRRCRNQQDTGDQPGYRLPGS